MPLELLATAVRRHRFAVSLIGVVTACAIIIPACGPGGGGADAPEPVATTLIFQSGPDDLVGGQSGTYVAKLRDPNLADISGAAITYGLATPDQAVSINPTTGVLTVSAVQPQATRTVTVTATATIPANLIEQYKAPTAVNKPVTIRSRLTGITLSALAANSVTPTTALTLRVGDPVATLSPIAAFAAGASTTPAVSYTFTSSNPALASVDALGRITAIAATTTSVTITAGAEGVTSSAVTVTVLPPVTTTIMVTVPTSATLPLVPGEQVTLQTNVSNAPAGTGAITFASANSALVSVTATSGQITAVAPTTTPVRITATYTNGSTVVTGFTDISVVARVATTIGLRRLIGGVGQAATPLTLDQGKRDTLAAVVRDQRSEPLPNAPVTFTSSATAVATVTASGIVTAVAPGVANIVATTGTLSAQVAITVPTPPANPTIAVTQSQPAVPAGPTAPISLDVATSTKIGVTIANPVAGGTLGIEVRNPSLATYYPSDNTGSSAVGSLFGKAKGSTFLDVTYRAGTTIVTQAIPLTVGSTAPASRVARVILEPQNNTVAIPVGFSYRPRFVDAAGITMSAADVTADGGIIRFFNSNDAVGTVTQSVPAPTTAAFAPRAAGTTNVLVVYSKNDISVAADNTNANVVNSTENIGSLTNSTSGDARTVRVGTTNGLLLQVIVRDKSNFVVTTGTAPTVTLTPDFSSPSVPVATLAREANTSGFFYTIVGVTPGNYSLKATLGSISTTIPIVIVP
ncbi:Ig-like domain-containing protein [Gemmatimonas sp.]|uniref:Ig-like domain-containing protein n=1 Tax=Gemmatimonas sp. TaxID=1962908 RepID=UPI003982D976